MCVCVCVSHCIVAFMYHNFMLAVLLLFTPLTTYYVEEEKTMYVYNYVFLGWGNYRPARWVLCWGSQAKWCVLTLSTQSWSWEHSFAWSARPPFQMWSSSSSLPSQQFARTQCVKTDGDLCWTWETLVLWISRRLEFRKHRRMSLEAFHAG